MSPSYSSVLIIALACLSAPVQVRAALGEVATLAGQGAGGGFVDGQRFEASFSAAVGVAFNPDSNTLYVADMANNAVRMVFSDGTVATLWSSPGRGIS